MLSFLPPSAENRAAIDRILFALPDPGCEYSYVNFRLWGQAQVCVQGDTLFVLTRHAGGCGYFLPAGGDLAEAVQTLALDARERGIPLSMYGVTARAKAELEQRFPGTFSFYEVRSGFDYVYDVERLAELKGRKLQAKRNHIHRFEDACPDCEILELTPERLPLAERMAADWYAAHLAAHPEANFRAEQRALSLAFAHYTDFGFEGLLLRSGGRIVAMTMGTRIRHDVFDVNFEKAVPDVPGAYAAVNRAFARHLHAKYPELTRLNREDDMGIEGLRKAKLSYYPDELLEKWVTISTPEAVLREPPRPLTPAEDAAADAL